MPTKRLFLAGGVMSSIASEIQTVTVLWEIFVRTQSQEAIGYVGLSHSGNPVKSVSVNGVPCKASTIRSQTYPLFRYDWGVIPTSGANVQVEQFLSWVRSSAAAGKIINKAGAVAAFNK